MVLAYYLTMFAVSLLLTFIYVFKWHRHFDVNFTLMFAFIPISNLGQVMRAVSTTRDAAILSNMIVYLGGCFPVLFVTLGVLSLCKLRPGRTLTAVMLLICTTVYLSSLTIGTSDMFYKDFDFVVNDGVGFITNKVYGPMHHVFYVMLCVYFLVSLVAMTYSYFRKKDVSNRIIYLMFLPELLAMVSFFGGKLILLKVELVPLSFVVAQIVYLIIIWRVYLYDIEETVIDSLVQSGSTGVISFDSRLFFLGSNETAKNIFPALRTLTVDEPISQTNAFNDTLSKWLLTFMRNEKENKTYYTAEDGRIYLADIHYLSAGSSRKGYQIFLTDDTKNQQYITLLDRYNSDLRSEVARKTANIVEMHDKLILGMATMVESRDNSTGGHIRRTSEVVKILTNEIRKDGKLGLSEEFCRDLVKAAPMHDLGKIAVDDAILRKPGRFTDEEFEKMKTHAAEGAKIVHTILEGTDDETFHIIAENVAHFHHERWDGSGYPNGLKGEQIPLEARIMAIADVYDALVSKRVYKEKMSFEQADKIIMEGMGKHFDKQLEPYYVSARPKLEAYYSDGE